MKRRDFLLNCGTAGLAWNLGWLIAQESRADESAAEGPSKPATSSTIPRAAQQAIDQGLKYLANKQNDDGSFGEGLYSRNVGVCSLVGMAFVGCGSSPRRGPYGAQVQKLVDFLLGCCQESGFISYPSAVSHGPMYEHGFATLWLAEAYGMSDSPQLREKLARAVRLIVEKQNAEGGWRYFPERREADISVTIGQLTALRAAKNAGIHVPANTIERCIEYIKKCQNADGGFMYMLQAGGASRFPRSAAGVLAFYNAGIYEGQELRRGLEYLQQFRPGGTAPQADAESYYFYGHYYAAQAMWQAGGEYWNRWYPAVVQELVRQQRADGSWQDTVSPIYGTAMACLILQTPHNHLSVFQK